MTFPFDELENVAVFCCKDILENDADICYVSHDEDDGAWQFLCGKCGHIDSDARIVSLKEIFNIDSSIGELADMPLGCYAIREKKHSSWKKYHK